MNIITICDPSTLIIKNEIRDHNKSANELKELLHLLGVKFGLEVRENNIETKNIITPMNVSMNTTVFKLISRIVVTTRDDKDTLGSALSISLGGAQQGYMDFEGRRSLQALNEPIRHIELPKVHQENIDELIIGKSVLATGCTAISLAKAAVEKYKPKKLYVATIFYSEAGLADLYEIFPEADIIVCGEPDDIQDDGMLIPGVGNIDLRIC